MGDYGNLCIILSLLLKCCLYFTLKIIYGIIYGISPKTLGIFLNLNETEAYTLIDSFKSTFPGLKKFISTQIDCCRTKGFVETIRNRRRSLPNISSLDSKLRGQVSNVITKSSF